MIAIATLLLPLLLRLADTLDEWDIRHLDETVLQILKEAGRAAIHPTSACRRAVRPDDPWYSSTTPPSHAHIVVLELLADARGFIQVDGYAAYGTVAEKHGGLTLVGCWGHARRKFDETVKGQPAGKAQQGMTWIRRLYAIEKRLHEAVASPDEIHRVR